MIAEIYNSQARVWESGEVKTRWRREREKFCQSLMSLTHWFVYRCCEVFCIYCQSDQNEEPYVSITKKWLPDAKNGLSEEVEKEVGQAEGKLFTHRSAFSRASVIQAFLGSAPQLTLQLYITVLEQNITTGRCMFACFFVKNNSAYI